MNFIRTIQLLAICLALIISLSVVRADPNPTTKRILIIKSRDISFYDATLHGFLDGLKARGYYSANGTQSTIIALTGDPVNDSKLVRSELAQNNSLVFTLGTDASVEVQTAHPASPCLFTMILDPVSLGLVKSMAEPGLNFTGTTLLVDPAKQLETFLQVSNAVKKVGVLYTDGNATSLAFLASAKEESTAMNVQILAVPLADYASGGHDALVTLASKVDAFWLIVDPASAGPQALTDTLAVAKQDHLPVLGMSNSNVRDGALLSLSANLKDLGDVDAEMACPLLDGSMTASAMPVRGPRQTLLSINLITAKALGQTVPDSLLHFADEVIDDSLATPGN
jgi:putative ABC transport system substrate-binding protein